MDIILFALMLLAISSLVVGAMDRDVFRLLSRYVGLPVRFMPAGLSSLAAMLFVGFTLVADSSLQEENIEDVSGPHQVVRVVDGDTVRVDVDGEEEPVRVIGLDAPETVHPSRDVECYGEEASEYARELLDGSEVMLEHDSSQGDRDRYSRLLRHVVLEDGRNFAEVMIGEGYAFEYTFNLPYRYQDEFKAAELAAREDERGLWHPDACDGDRQVEIEPTPEGVVKMSNSGICHAPGTTYYQATLSYTSYESLEDCLDDGGRLPNR